MRQRNWLKEGQRYLAMSFASRRDGDLYVARAQLKGPLVVRLKLPKSLRIRSTKVQI
jgi:hypothetical protein